MAKLIYDDRDVDNAGWFVRIYNGNEQADERTFEAEADADAETLIREAGVSGEVEIYRSISQGLPSETLTA